MHCFFGVIKKLEYYVGFKYKASSNHNIVEMD